MGEFSVLKNRTGEINYNVQGSQMKIIAYRNAHDFDVEFETGHIITCYKYKDFEDGTIKDDLMPSVYKIGYLGIGQYNSKTKINNINFYYEWKNIFHRCYSNKQRTYIDCYVDPIWYNYQNFSEWLFENMYVVPNHRMCVDKDILVKNNKKYGPDTCLFVPEEINHLFKKPYIKRDLPIGVQYKRYKSKIKYQVNLSYKRWSKNINMVSDSLEEAFTFYKEKKEEYIKYVADLYKDQIPQKVYDALYAYEVEITD